MPAKHSGEKRDRKKEIDEILKKYGPKIESQMKGGFSRNTVSKNEYSKEYLTFKKEMAPQLSRYEKWCHALGNIIKINVSEKDQKSIKRQLEIAQLNVEPWQALSLSLMSFLGILLFGMMISAGTFLITNSFPTLFFMLIILFSVFVFYYLRGAPERIANKWRLKASSQMVPAILYIVVYMRHTSNLEKAISFASQHLEYPLSLDLKKVFYNVEIGKFSTIKESLENYLDGWRDYSPEFVESFNLVESSLFEPEESKRILTLERALQVILDGVYDKMLKFVHDVKSPIQSTYMLGTTLPVLGLALLPLASIMLGDILKTNHVFVLYNLLIPFIALYLMDKYMMMRPGGHGETDLLERNPLYSEYKKSDHYLKAFLICLPLFILGFLPFIFQYTPLPEILNIPKDFTLSQIGFTFFGEESFFGFIQKGGRTYGPFGIGSLILGLFIPLGVALFFSISYKNKTKNLIIKRENTNSLENEFKNSLFQLGNKVGGGTPPELAFGRVAESSKGLKTADFFRLVDYNIRQMGMSVDRAIFDRTRGAINQYPSNLISTSMRIFIESSKKGLKIASISLMSISQYIKNIQKISARLKDMLAEIISDMKSNMTFLAPLLSGVVIGLAVMISSILGKISELEEVGGGEAIGIGGIEGVMKMFEQSHMIPPYFLQIAIGIYLVQIIFILTNTLVTIDSGEDKLSRTHQTGKNLIKGISLYIIVALFSTIALFVLSSVVLSGL